MYDEEFFSNILYKLMDNTASLLKQDLNFNKSEIITNRIFYIFQYIKLNNKLKNPLKFEIDSKFPIYFNKFLLLLKDKINNTDLQNKVFLNAIENIIDKSTLSLFIILIAKYSQWEEGILLFNYSNTEIKIDLKSKKLFFISLKPELLNGAQIFYGGKIIDCSLLKKINKQIQLLENELIQTSIKYE